MARGRRVGGRGILRWVVRVLGHGIDLVEIERVRDLLARHGARFRERCFTPDELAYAARRPRREAEHLAVRFAAKEAVLKALGTGRRHEIQWRDVSVLRLPTGAPQIEIVGAALEVATALGVVEWSVSLTHTDRTAAASALALGAD